MQTTTIAPIKTVHVIPAKPEFTEKENNNKILRVAAYCRVSTKKDEQHMSYEAQKEFYTAKIMKKPNWRYVDTYGDKGITGTIASKREDFMRMIKDCKDGKIDLIITKSFERFARNTLDTIRIVRMLKAMNIGVIFETQGLDTSKEKSEFMLTVYAGMAQAGSENLSTNVKWGNQHSYAKGNVRINCKHFLGYRMNEDNRLEIDPDEALIIQRIYNDFIAGQTHHKIADNLTRQGILTPMKKTVWRSSTVQSILSNEKYCGDAILQKTFVTNCLTHEIKKNNGELPQYHVKDNHPAIIPRDMWNRVQEELKRRGSKSKVKQVGTKTEQGKYSSKFALTEILYCGECATPYRRCTWSKNGKKKVVWRCISRLDYGKKYCKESASIEESILHEAILEALAKGAKESTAGIEYLKQSICTVISDVDSNEDGHYMIQARICELDTELSRLYDLQEDDSTGDYESQFEALYHEQNALKAKLAEIKAANNHISARKSRLDSLFAVVDGIRNRPLEWDEQAIRQMIESVRILSKEKISVKFNWGSEVEVNLKNY